MYLHHSGPKCNTLRQLQKDSRIRNLLLLWKGVKQLLMEFSFQRQTNQEILTALLHNLNMSREERLKAMYSYNRHPNKSRLEGRYPSSSHQSHQEDGQLTLGRMSTRLTDSINYHNHEQKTMPPPPNPSSRQRSCPMDLPPLQVTQSLLLLDPQREERNPHNPKPIRYIQRVQFSNSSL